MNALIVRASIEVTLTKRRAGRPRNAVVWGYLGSGLLRYRQISRGLPKNKPLLAYIQTAG